MRTSRGAMEQDFLPQSRNDLLQTVERVDVVDERGRRRKNQAVGGGE